MSAYPIGTPGTPWSDDEKAQWFEAQTIKRSYKEEVLDKLELHVEGLALVQYGALPYDEARYPLFAYLSETIDVNKPTVLVTGGVHGYETSGVQGALLFARTEAAHYLDKCNLIIAPCVSPWGYETINRWNPNALDPNRSFYPDSPAAEPAAIMQFVQSLKLDITMHIDLHETTDTDNSEFRPALAARDGTTHDNWNIPDGFYLVADTNQPQMAFQQAIINAVKAVTHIAPADENGRIIGAEVESEGVICYDKPALFLCGGFANARFCTTTEVYPDSPTATPDICNQAQVVAVSSGIEFVLANL